MSSQLHPCFMQFLLSKKTLQTFQCFQLSHHHPAFCNRRFGVQVSGHFFGLGHRHRLAGLRFATQLREQFLHLWGTGLDRWGEPWIYRIKGNKHRICPYVAWCTLDGLLCCLLYPIIWPKSCRVEWECFESICCFLLWLLQQSQEQYVTYSRHPFSLHFYTSLHLPWKEPHTSIAAHISGK